MNKNKIIGLCISVFLILIILGLVFFKSDDKKLQKQTVQEVTNAVLDNLKTYNMSNEDVKQLPTTEVPAQNVQEEEKAGDEQTAVEKEGFKEQGEIEYNGSNKAPNVNLGNYKGLTYYSQIDSRWRYHSYTSTGNSNQNIGNSGCGPTSAAMVVTAIKGSITPPEMGDLFVQNGYRSANNGTYFSAFRWIADIFDIGYDETYDFDYAMNLLRNNYYVVVSCGNGLFTYGGHFIVLTGIADNTIKIYDPYLYAGKFETSTRRGKVAVDGTTAYCSTYNFRKYAHYTKFFAYKHGNEVQENIQSVHTNSFIRYVNAQSGLNVRNKPNGTRIGGLTNGTIVNVYETSGEWSRIGDNRWVNSNYLAIYNSNTTSYINQNTKSLKTKSRGRYLVTASTLNVRYGASTRYARKTWRDLSRNAREQNRKHGSYYTNGYKRGVICNVSKIKGNWGLTPSGWICLDYCKKI